MTLKNKIALIIGGGNGLGRAIAQAYAECGATLIIADLDLVSAKETLKICQQEESGLACRLDISDVTAIKESIQNVVQRYNRLDILVNCAAICLVDQLLDVTAERWDKVFDINARGAFIAMQEAARVMIPKKAGRIILVSSPASKMGFPLFASYAASKAVVDSLARAATVAWAQFGVTTNCIVPGRMTGGMVDALELDLAKVTGKSIEELKANRTNGVPMQRRVDPNEVAQAAVWLASDAAAYVSGERFNFTGGMELA